MGLIHPHMKIVIIILAQIYSSLTNVHFIDCSSLIIWLGRELSIHVLIKCGVSFCKIPKYPFKQAYLNYLFGAT